MDKSLNRKISVIIPTEKFRLAELIIKFLDVGVDEGFVCKTYTLTNEYICDDEIFTIIVNSDGSYIVNLDIGCHTVGKYELSYFDLAMRGWTISDEQNHKFNIFENN